MKQLNDSGHKPLYLQVAEVKVSYKNKVPVNERVQIKQSADAERVLRSNWSEDMELVEELYPSVQEHIRKKMSYQ